MACKQMTLDQMLQQYIGQEFFREALQIPEQAEVVLEPLAQGEYNINYVFVHPSTGKKLVLRVNTGSQMHLEHQIEYEFDALKILDGCGRTPKPVYVDGSKKSFPYGVMVLEYLEGNPLVYERDLHLAAEILADIHSVPVKNNSSLIDPGEPLQAILDECYAMVQTYYDSPLADPARKEQIRSLLERGQNLVDRCGSYDRYRCLINTELNSGNFLIGGEGKANYLIDWEKPLYGEVAQDLGHFLAPTTTFWKTDTILTPSEMMAFVEDYIRAVDGRFCTDGLKERVNLFVPITCLRGITWCAMAWVEYQSPDRMIKNEFTYRKIQAYLTEEFLNRIEEICREI